MPICNPVSKYLSLQMGEGGGGGGGAKSYDGEKASPSINIKNAILSNGTYNCTYTGGGNSTLLPNCNFTSETYTFELLYST
jgi:hypothetical protein